VTSRDLDRARAVAPRFGMILRLGTVDRVFADAEHVVETTFRAGDGPTAPATTLTIKSAVTTDGRITARRFVVSRHGDPANQRKSVETSVTALYDIDSLEIDLGPLGGDDLPQLVWAHESHTDMLARRLGLDPFDLRRRNIRRDGAIEPVLTLLEQRMGWRGRVERGTRALRRGRGVAIGVQPASDAVIAAAGVEVTVDTATGQARVIRLVGAADRGGARDAVVADDLTLDPDQLVAASLAGVTIAALEGTPGFAVAAAIANAIDDAVGVRLLTPALTAEAIHRGLRAGIGAPLSATAT